MKLVELIAATIFRDGGSFAAIFETDEGTGYGLRLERSRMPDRQGLHHGPLFEFIQPAPPSYPVDPPDGCPSIVPGSADERRVLQLIDDFLLKISEEQAVEPSEALRRVREMRRYIERRDRQANLTPFRSSREAFLPSPPSPEQQRAFYDALGPERAG